MRMKVADKETEAGDLRHTFWETIAVILQEWCEPNRVA